MSQIHAIKQGQSDVVSVKSVQFGVLSPEAILNQSTAHIFRHMTKGGEQAGTLADPRLGATQNTRNAVTYASAKTDHGNFGHCHLALPVYHPLFYEYVYDIMKVICPGCSSLRETSDYNLAYIKAMVGSVAPPERLGVILAKIGTRTKSSTCPHCKSHYPEIINDNDAQVLGMAMVYHRKAKGKKVAETKKGAGAGAGAAGGSVKEAPVAISAKQVHEILKRVTDEDCETLGINHKYARPDWMVITILPICPPTIRPSVVTDDGKTSDDDITQSLHNIIKFNNKLKETLDSRDTAVDKDAHDRQIALDHRTLQLHIASLVDNETSKYPTICNRANRPLRTIKARLKGKTGRVRGNLMGKRVDFSARTVITADPNLSITQVGIPYHIAMTLTYPEYVNEHNQAYLTTLVQRGPENYPGANEIKLPNSSYPTNLSCISEEERMHKTLPIGTIVYRHMLDGDLVILNRQPSLHKMSMMCHRAKILQGNSFRLSVNITSPYGADFDGDEMNIHLLQSEMARREWQSLALSSTQMVSPQANKPVVGAVQDTVLAMYRLSSEHFRGYSPKERYYLNLRDYMHLMAWANQNTGHYPKVSKAGWTAVDMFNMIMPPITINKTNGSGNSVTIINGIMQGPKPGERLGNMDTATGLLKMNYGSLFHVAWNDLGHTAASDLIDNMSRISSQWLLIDGFSVGLRDLEIPKKYMYEIEDYKRIYLDRIQALLNGLHEGRYTEDFRASLDLGPPGLVENVYEQFELDIMHLMATCREKGQGVAFKHINEYDVGVPYDNRFMNMVNSGSKGNKSNVVQIIALLGNQDMGGKRVSNFYNRRPLAFVSKDDLGAESRGFIANSYTKGLSFMEYIYHAMSGRNGVISTSIKTAETGYLQRKLMKRLEDIVANYDGTVRGGGGIIIQYVYGGDGYDGSKLERQSLNHIGWNMEELLLRFNFSETDWANLKEMTARAGAEFNLDTEKEAVNQEFARIIEDWTYLRQRYRYNLPDGIPSVVNFDRMLKSIAHRMGIRGQAPYMQKDEVLLPSYIFGRVSDLERVLRLPTTASINKYSLKQFFTLLRAKLSSRYLIFMHTYNRASFDALLDEIKRKFYQGIVAPGEAVGALAAQSIGEPGTQMTLDAFHSTGSKATVSAGVPRFKEILSVTSVKMPSIAIYLTGIGIPDDIMQTVRDGLGNQTLPATIRSVDMYLSHVAETDRNRAIELKKDFVNRYLLSSGNKFNSIFGVRDSFEYLTYGDVIVRSDVMYVESAEDDPDAAILADMNGFDDLIETAEVPYPIWLVKFEIGRKHNHDWSHTEISPIGSDKESWEMQFTYLPGAERGYIRGVLPAKDATMEHIAKAEDELRERPLKGIAGIRKTTIRTEKKDIKLDDGTIVARDSARYSELAPISMDAETYIIDTIGSNLMEITSMDHVDPYRTFTNDITEMMAIYGIEVARRSIIRELNQVLIGAGIQIDIRHITLLADAMTCRGFIQKIDRFGAKKGESGPLALASFEETTAMLGMAAAQAETDTLGVSANIMVGQFVKLGTNSFETYLDENMLLQYAEKPAVARTLIDLTDNTDECNMEDLGRFEFVL
jgi:DNA-directed RNA polymerase II subunit RPB1